MEAIWQIAVQTATIHTENSSIRSDFLPLTLRQPRRSITERYLSSLLSDLVMRHPETGDWMREALAARRVG